MFVKICGLKTPQDVAATVESGADAMGLVLSSTSPRAVTVEQASELVEAVGSAQYVTLDQAVDALTYQAVTPDFYERYSASRATRTTSSS